jgi:hypothetical protein
VIGSSFHRCTAQSYRLRMMGNCGHPGSTPF